MTGTTSKSATTRAKNTSLPPQRPTVVDLPDSRNAADVGNTAGTTAHKQTPREDTPNAKNSIVRAHHSKHPWQTPPVQN